MRDTRDSQYSCVISVSQTSLIGCLRFSALVCHLIFHNSPQILNWVYLWVVLQEASDYLWLSAILHEDRAAVSILMYLMIGVLRPFLCTCYAKWAKRPPKVMKRSQRWNNLQICPRRDSNTDPFIIVLGGMKYIPAAPRHDMAPHPQYISCQNAYPMASPCSLFICVFRCICVYSGMELLRHNV